MRISDWSSDVCSSDLLAQAHAHSRPPEIHDLRLLVHLATNAVPAKFTHNRVAILFGVPLDCEADGADMGARPHLPYAFPHRLLRDTNQPSCGRCNVQIGRHHVLTPVTHANLVCRL